MWTMFTPCRLALLIRLCINIILSIRVCICVLCVHLFLKIIVYCTFYSICNTDASDVCAIKITYLLTSVELMKSEVCVC